MNQTWIWVGTGLLAIALLIFIGSGRNFIKPTPAPLINPLTPISTSTQATTTPTPEPPPPRYALGKPQLFKVGYQKIFVGDLIVTMIEQNDSRCQPGTQCIWAGEISYVFTVVGGGIDPSQNITLGTITKKSVTVGDYIFNLSGADETKVMITVTRTTDTAGATPPFAEQKNKN